jgi:hypothetical protein
MADCIVVKALYREDDGVHEESIVFPAALLERTSAALRARHQGLGGLALASRCAMPGLLLQGSEALQDDQTMQDAQSTQILLNPPSIGGDLVLLPDKESAHMAINLFCTLPVCLERARSPEMYQLCDFNSPWLGVEMRALVDPEENVRQECGYYQEMNNRRAQQRIEWRLYDLNRSAGATPPPPMIGSHGWDCCYCYRCPHVAKRLETRFKCDCMCVPEDGAQMHNDLLEAAGIPESNEAPLNNVVTNEHGFLPTFCEINSTETIWSFLQEHVFFSDFDWAGICIAGGSVARMVFGDLRNIYVDFDFDFFIYDPVNYRQILNRTIAYFLRAQSFDNVFLTRCSNAALTISLLHKNSIIELQFILTRFCSIEQVLLSFDIDACCDAYDGQSVLVLPHTLIPWILGYQVVHPDNASWNYTERLLKYSSIVKCRLVVPGLLRRVLPKHKDGCRGVAVLLSGQEQSCGHPASYGGRSSGNAFKDFEKMVPFCLRSYTTNHRTWFTLDTCIKESWIGHFSAAQDYKSTVELKTKPNLWLLPSLHPPRDLGVGLSPVVRSDDYPCPLIFTEAGTWELNAWVKFKELNDKGLLACSQPMYFSVDYPKYN